MRKLNFLKTKAGLLKTLLFVSLIVIFFKCRKEDEVPTPTPTTSTAPKLTVMSNSTDPLLMTALTQGKTIEYFGQRDANGTPTVVTDVIIKSPTETLKYKVDPDGRPLKMVANDGTEFEFNWLADDHTVVTVTASDGSTQVNMELKNLTASGNLLM